MQIEDRMSNRRKLKPLHGGRRPQLTPQATVSAFSRMARKSCSECGAPVRWVDDATAEGHGMDVEGALGFLGSSVDQVEWWVCTACDNAGVMGPATAG
jgi:hypothetical protein